MYEIQLTFAFYLLIFALKFRSEMKFNLFEFALSHVENELRISHKHIAASFINCHLLMFPVFEFG